MLTVVMKNATNARNLLRSLPGCTCFPKINGFEIKEEEMHIVISDLDDHPQEMDEEEFIYLVKSVYNCAKRGIYFGPVGKDNVKIQHGKPVIVPNFNASPIVISGRIENPFSFFTTVRTLANVFRKSSGWPSKIYREKLSAIFQLMKELSLPVLNSPLFLPSVGVWRHDKFVEKLKKAQGSVFVPVIGAEGFIPLISKMGKIFSSLEEIRKEVYKEKAWRNIFSNENELRAAGITPLALLFDVDKDTTYIFNSANSIEMHTFCNELREFHPDVKIVEFLEPYFKVDPRKTLIPPRISKEEIGWFLKTFFGSKATLKTDLDSLFADTKGEIFSISHLILKGKWEYVNDEWQVYPARYERPNPFFLIKEARRLARNGEKPKLGLELIETAENIYQKKLELFESLKAFFFKVLGRYEEMDFHFKEAEEFGRRTFRNAYYSIVLAMNGMNFSLLQNKTTPLVEIMRKYAIMVSTSENVESFYSHIISPLEKIRSIQARRIECMARNYVGILLESREKTEEAIDEFETALSLAHEYDFKDLEPLIEVNIASALEKKMPIRSHEKALQALKNSMNEGLEKIVSFSYLILASNSIEMGEFEKGKFFLKNAYKAYAEMKPFVENLKMRMKIEDLQLDGLKELEDEEEREFLEFLYALYVDDKEKIWKMLKNSNVSKIKKLSIFTNFESFDENKVESMDYLSAYFLARYPGRKHMLFLKNLGKNIYMNNVNIRKIFYEEQLSNAYRLNGFEKSANYHLHLAVSICRQMGLKKRASYLSNKIRSRSFMKTSYDLFSFYMAFRYFSTTYEIVRSLTINVSKLLKNDVTCWFSGVEEYVLHATPDGIIWNTNEKPDSDFAWAFGKDLFVYQYQMENGVFYIGFQTKNVVMDEALLMLDHLVPFYAMHVERSIATKVSNIDSLTRLYSRRYIMNRLAEEVERSKRYGESLSVAMLDIDNFKRINDRNGHDVGDEALRRVAELVMDNVRSIDVVGRYGGEEFLIIFPHTPLDHAVKSCERIRKKIEKARIIPSNLTVSIGVTQLTEDEDVDSVVKKADIALYWAKSYGKNCVVPYFEKKVEA